MIEMLTNGLIVSNYFDNRLGDIFLYILLHKVRLSGLEFLSVLCTFKILQNVM